MFEYDTEYMGRALRLARCGLGNVSPNPMVGSVIVGADGRILGEGYHRRYGQGHAEVNAIASVAEADRPLLHDATMYVTLEPCSHYGKTPPCAKLIIDTGIPRVVVGARDPFEAVSGRGIAMLRDAGVDVVVGVMERESRELNASFITAHTHRRPFVMLKWACSADGFMDVRRSAADAPYRFSGRLGQTLVHRQRSLFDAIMVGAGTVAADNPRLDVRLWSGRSPRPVVLGDIPADAAVMKGDPIVWRSHAPVDEVLADLYSRGITSLMVEGGAAVLRSFVEAGLWDVARVERAPVTLGADGRAPSPSLPGAPVAAVTVCNNNVSVYSNNPLVTPGNALRYV